MHCRCTVSSSSFCKLTLHLFHLIAAFSDFRRYRHAASSPHSSLYINITRTRSSLLGCSHQKREVVAGVLHESTYLFFLTRTRDQQINKRYTKCLFSVARFPLFLFSFLLLYCVLLIACACFSTVHVYSYYFSSFHFFFSFYGVSLRRRVRDSFDAGSRVTRSCNQLDADRRTFFFSDRNNNKLSCTCDFLSSAFLLFFPAFFNSLLCFALLYIQSSKEKTPSLPFFASIFHTVSLFVSTGSLYA